MPTSAAHLALLALAVLATSALYSAGGQAGASAYVAAMALLGVPAATLRPTALLMNVVVAATGTLQVARARALPWGLLLPLAAGSIPAAFLGGALPLPSRVHAATIGALLALAALRLWLPLADVERPRPGAAVLVAIGAAVGLVAGLSGIGGGVLLAPILLLSGWERPLETARVSIVFILLNSLAALAGHLTSMSLVPWQAAPLGAVALGGAVLGSRAGLHRLRPAVLRRLQASILLLSAIVLLTDAARPGP